MGSPDIERQKVVSEGLPESNVQHEVPQHDVSIGSFEIAKSEVTRAQYAAFVHATGYPGDGGCAAPIGGKWTHEKGLSWRNPGFKQDDAHPVVCVSWVDAQAYISWLNGVTGKKYRLPSESEWEYVARAGGKTRFPWGNDDGYRAICKHANGPDQSTKLNVPGMEKWFAANCDDGNAYTGKVAKLLPNMFAVYDMHGNVWEWTMDCFEPDYAKGQPIDGAAHRPTDSSCEQRVLRGGSWYDNPQVLRSAVRGRSSPSLRANNNGFRLARSIR